MGFTGKGVVVAVVDEGLEKNHPELKQNFVSWVSSLFKQTVDKYIPNLIEPVRRLPMFKCWMLGLKRC